MRNSTDFAQGVLNEFRSLQKIQTKAAESLELSHSIAQNAVSTGHPLFADLAFGDSGHCSAAAMFIDLQDFTGRTFWDSAAEVVQLAQAVLNQVAQIVTQYGGYVLGLRGDGLFACFGPHPSRPDIDVTLCLAAGAFALDATKNALNQLLLQSGIRPVQLRVGADYGRLDFTRTGTADVSEVNVIGFAANFAAKCEKYANAWEFVVGEGLRYKISDAGMFSEHERSPKRYTRDYETKTYRFYEVSWVPLLATLPGIQEELQGRPTSAIQIY